MIHRLRLRNFKGVVEGEAELDKLTILVGPNNSGKTTILEALFLAPNPFRKVPYVPNTAVELLSESHKIFNETGYHFLFNKYTSDSASIEVDERVIVLKKFDQKFGVYTNYVSPGWSLEKHRIGDEELFFIGILPSAGPVDVRYTDLIAPNTLLLSTKLVKFAHEYLRLFWMDIVNAGITASVAKEISEFVSEDYANITAEPYVSGVLSLFAMLSNGTRVRLSDLGAGVHLYIVNRLLYEHYKPEVVLWDDLETHLNPRLLSHVAEWFADLVEEGKQVIVSTHSLEVVETLTAFVEDAAVLLTSLRDGKLKVRKLGTKELEEWVKAGIDPRYAEALML